MLNSLSLQFKTAKIQIKKTVYIHMPKEQHQHAMQLADMPTIVCQTTWLRL